MLLHVHCSRTLGGASRTLGQLVLLRVHCSRTLGGASRTLGQLVLLHALYTVVGHLVALVGH